MALGAGKARAVGNGERFLKILRKADEGIETRELKL